MRDMASAMRAERKATVLDVISSVKGADPREIVQELWGNDWTIVRRQRDPFDVDPKMIPRGMSYQWNSKDDWRERVQNGWAAVPADRHDGVFAPVGYGGDIEHGGMVLMERSKAAVDAAHSERIEGAHKNVDGWIQRNAGGGFSGGVRVWTGEVDRAPSGWRKFGDETHAKIITSAVPPLRDDRVIAVDQTTVTRAPLGPKPSWIDRFINRIFPEK